MYKPYSVGSWYRFFIESSGSGITITKSDIEGTSIENNALVLPEGYRVLDVVTDINSIASAMSYATYGDKIIKGDGRQGYLLPSPEAFDYGFIYVFALRAS